MRTDRIVQRQTQRTELHALKEFVKTSRPLMEADKQLRRAYMAGYKKRLQEEVEESKAKVASMDPAQVDDEIAQELSQAQVEPAPLPVHTSGYMQLVDEIKSVPTDEKEQIRDVLETKYPEVFNSLEQPVEPRNDSQDSRPSQAYEQPPVG